MRGGESRERVGREEGDGEIGERRERGGERERGRERAQKRKRKKKAKRNRKPLLLVRRTLKVHTMSRR